jgi:hypothetical protein
MFCFCAIKKLLEERKTLREQSKSLYERVKIEVKPLAAELDKQRYEKTKLLTKESGLWWCNNSLEFRLCQWPILMIYQSEANVAGHGIT